jgi:diaminohydroxyphosphoribosylaminopyrimidine deaminase / 5-amino-6-(5-phosphoribosylamino)uracil reductase
VTDDARWMALALSVARRASPDPNPRVGAIVVQRDRFVALGWHERAGDAHAEVAALAAAGEGARGSTLYVTLEPCNPQGKTPPCVEAILAAGVNRVVIGCCDPNPHVTGGGVARLRRHGVDVCVGVRAEDARRLIEAWARRVAGDAGSGRVEIESRSCPVNFDCGASGGPAAGGSLTRANLGR